LSITNHLLDHSMVRKHRISEPTLFQSMLNKPSILYLTWKPPGVVQNAIISSILNVKWSQPVEISYQIQNIVPW
jgi:hypothetical protein